ncbi:MAG: ATP-binding protein [Stomatobaculum sp.]
MALSNSQFNAILREYERIQSENRREWRERRAQVMAAVPELGALERKAAVSALDRLKKAVREGDGTAVGGFSEEVGEIERKKAELLHAAGFPPDALEMHYHCADCRDTGFIEGEKCHCFHARAIKLLYAQAKLDRIMEKENFRKFSLDWYDDTRVITAIGMTERAWMRRIEEQCRRYAAEFSEKHGSILFQGNTGVGKTFLSNSIAKELIERGNSVIYLTAAEFFDCMAKVRIEKTEELTLRELYGYIFSCDLLILDDLGTEVTNTFSASQLFYMVNSRLNEQRGTVISTNLSMRMLRDTYSDRTTSRITSGYDILMLYGDDIRAKKRMKELGL